MSEQEIVSVIVSLRESEQQIRFRVERSAARELLAYLQKPDSTWVTVGSLPQIAIRAESVAAVCVEETYG